MLNSISKILNDIYKIEAMQVEKTQGGWSADAYYIKSMNQDYFLKIFDKHRHTAQMWINRIEYYMPLVIWLNNNTDFRDELVMPAFTYDGLYKFENEDYIFILYPYINGYTLAEKKLTHAQQEDLATIVAKLHFFGQKIPSQMLSDVENFDVSFCDELSVIQ